MSTPVLPEYVAPYKPVPQVTPFTYRDGVTMLKKLELLQKYINKTLVPFVNDNMEELGNEFEEQVNILIAAVNAAIDAVINDSVDVQDAVVAQIFQSVSSATRNVTDDLYAAKSLEQTVQDVAQNLTDFEAEVNSTFTALTNRMLARSARHPKDFGAVGDGVVDDTEAIIAAVASGYAIYWGGPTDIYRVTADINVTLTSNLVWTSSGATIFADPVSPPMQRVINIECQGFDVSISGPLTIDAAQKAFSCFRCNNGTDTFANIVVSDLETINAYRANQSMTGGDGIRINGAFNNVNIERPIVRNILMAVGAGIPLVQGVAGISVTSNGVGRIAREVNITSPYIENVYSEDGSYLQDQDGIRIFTEENTGSANPFETHFSIRGGRIKNAMGRSIKLQCEFGVIDGVWMGRRGTVPYNRTGGMPEVDFQTGGGIITNCEFSYVSNVPDRVIAWQGTLQTGGKLTNGIVVTNCKVTYSGSQQLQRFMTVTPAEQIKAVVVVENVEVMNNLSGFLTTAFLTTSGGSLTSEIIIRMMNISAPMDTGIPFYRRVGAAYPVQINMHNLATLRSNNAINGKFSLLDNAGSYTEVITGNNVRVVA